MGKSRVKGGGKMFEIKKVTISKGDNTDVPTATLTNKFAEEYHKPCDPEEGNCSPTATCSPATP